MLFNSIQFLFFFPVVALLYFAIPHKVRYIWLLAASYFFYMCWNPKYAILMMISTVITYASGLLIDSSNKKKISDKKKTFQKKTWVALSFTLNLAILFFFKYFDFAAENIAALFSFVGVTIVPPRFDIVLPVGISFYTFQALGYTIDVYRGDIYAEKNIARYALFVSFFPQLVAGPIERSKNLLKQISQKHTFDYNRMKRGLLLMLWGFFQKMVIADRAAMLVNNVYDNYEYYAGLQIVIATVLFAVQIYCDFSSYSNIAIGAAEVMGFKLMENFNTPYFATSVSDFWRRWHISLSTWFRDYLYLPLGGNRKGRLRKHINVMIVFLASGLWHGASWGFVIWGFLNGIFQVIGQELKPVGDYFARVFKVDRETFSHKVYKIITTFTLINFTWIFFRADTAKSAIKMIERIFIEFNPWIFFDDSLYSLGIDRKNFMVLLVALLILVVVSLCKYNKIHLREKLQKQSLWFRWLVYIVAIVFVLVYGAYGPAYSASQFIYFQF